VPRRKRERAKHLAILCHVVSIISPSLMTIPCLMSDYKEQKTCHYGRRHRQRVWTLALCMTSIMAHIHTWASHAHCQKPTVPDNEGIIVARC
jgi:hypothetical protein